jgi:uncharacterized protein YutE (UPF0331/DUF86 family)
MPIDKNLIRQKLNFLDQNLSKIERMDVGEEEFVENTDIHDLVTFRLQQSVETCIDIATHIIAELNLPRKDRAKDAFLFLGQEKVIENHLAEQMGKAADFRNRVVHGYNDFDFALLFKDYKKDIADLRSFGNQILEYIEKLD